MRVESKAFRTVRQEQRRSGKNRDHRKMCSSGFRATEAYPTMVVRNVGSADPPPHRYGVESRCQSVISSLRDRNAIHAVGTPSWAPKSNCNQPARRRLFYDFGKAGQPTLPVMAADAPKQRRPRSHQVTQPPRDINPTHLHAVVVFPYLIVGASSSSWRDGDGNNDEAPPVERGLLVRRMPLPASLLYCWSLMVHVRLVMVVTVPSDPRCK